METAPSKGVSTLCGRHTLVQSYLAPIILLRTNLPLPHSATALVCSWSITRKRVASSHLASDRPTRPCFTCGRSSDRKCKYVWWSMPAYLACEKKQTRISGEVYWEALPCCFESLDLTLRD